MCGLAGICSERTNLVDRVRDMTLVLAHRGPDGEGCWREGGVALGHRRLAILDLSDAGRQPMLDATGRFVGVLNGEIYNHRDLRRSLEGPRLRFRGTSDTEVLLEAFARWGEDVVGRLRGMFALAIYDRHNRTMFLARDHLGKKPLFWTPGSVPGELFFASELRALCRVLPLELDTASLGLYFHFGYLPEPRTVFRHVRSLPPGHCATWSPGGGMKLKAYWTVASGPERTGASAPRPDLDELDTLLRQAVERRLQSDVPLGAFLSGGVDSALVASYLTELRPGAPTITVGFDQRRWDESAAAARTAALLETEHHVERVCLPDAMDLLDEYVACFDQPFGDSSGVPALILARAARHQVTVALGGDGGDECFGGYDRYRWLMMQQRFGRLSCGVRQVLGGLATRVNTRRGNRMRSLLLARDQCSAYLELLRVWHHAPLDALLALPFDDPWTWFCAGGRWSAEHSLRSAQVRDLVQYLPSDILVKADRTSMWHGLESRSPLLDIDLVEWCLRHGVLGDVRELGKRSLRALLRRRLPHYDFGLPKRGFALPVEVWLAGPLRERLRAATDSGLLERQGIFRPSHVRETVDRFHRGEHSLHAPLWSFLVFQEWYQKHGPGSAP